MPIIEVHLHLVLQLRKIEIEVRMGINGFCILPKPGLRAQETTQRRNASYRQA